MASMILDRSLEDRVKAERAESGADRFDEVWEGVYMMAPLANNEHQVLVGRFNTILELVIGLKGLGTVCPGVNISDRKEGWTHNYRGPDVVVFLTGTKAIDCGTHWFGGPDFLIEVISPDDQSRDKLPFYSKVGVREALLVDRDPWSLELYRLRDGNLQLVGTSDAENGATLSSSVVPLSFRLLAGDDGPQIEVRHRDTDQHWLV